MKEPVDEDNLEKFLLEMSMYQDQLLQNYRLIFISSQTILISIAMLLLISGKGAIPSLLFFAMLFGIGWILISLWRAITENRELDVSYCHMQLLKLERGPKSLKPEERKRPFDSFKNWQQYNEDAKISKLDNYDKHLLGSPVRKKMKDLPNWYLRIWVVCIIVGIILAFNNQFHFSDFL